MPQVTPLHTHVFNAYYNWMVENSFKIQLVIDATALTDKSLAAYAGSNGVLILNCHPGSVIDFMVSDEGVSFGARFRGKHKDVMVDFGAIRFITGTDLYRNIHVELPIAVSIVDKSEMVSAPDIESPKPVKKRPTLKVVK